MNAGLTNAVDHAENKAADLIAGMPLDGPNGYRLAKDLHDARRSTSTGAGDPPRAHDLRGLRAIAWLAQSKTPNLGDWDALHPALDEWLGLLISARLARSFAFLSASPPEAGPLGTARDGDFAVRRLPFLARDWPYLSHQERELALTIFEWQPASVSDTGEDPVPALVWWLRDASPLVHDEIEDFLSRRYCFALRHALRNARRRDTHAPANAMARWRRDFIQSPRLGAFAAIGFLGLFGMDSAVVLAFASPWWVAGVGMLPAAIALLLITTLINSTNRGAGLPRPRTPWRAWESAGLRRAARTCSLYALWVMGILLAVGIAVGLLQRGGACEPALWPAGSLGNAVLPSIPILGGAPWSLLPRFVLGAAAFGAWVMLTGTLLQWFWEGKAAVERV
ncbi:MAG: hypothetical protein IPK72_21600 [Candidatus Eisenbacteria bacterium]|nr:hypothetical protein [Candidatus Eisenbacteria bacterium]